MKMNTYNKTNLKNTYLGAICLSLIASLVIAPFGYAYTGSRDRGDNEITGTAVPRIVDVRIQVLGERNRPIVGADILFVADDRSNSSHGVRLVTDSNGTASTRIQTGYFNIEIRKNGFNPKDLHTYIGLNSNDFTIRDFSLSSGSNPSPTPTTNPTINENCSDVASYLTGSITNTGLSGQATAQVNNSSSNCSFKVTFASYQMYALNGSDWINSQKLHNYKTVTVRPGSTTISITTPASMNCQWQLDLVEGDVLEVPYYGEQGRYFLDYEFAGPDRQCKEVVPTRNIISVTPACVNEIARIIGTNLDPTVQVFNSSGQRFTSLVGNTINSSRTEVLYRVPSSLNPGNYTLRVGPNLTDVSNTVSFTVLGSCEIINPNPVLSISKTVRNISTGSGEAESVSANANQTVEFVIRVSAANANANNVFLSDVMSNSYITYNSGSTTVNGSSVGDGIIGSGINLGTLSNGNTSVVRFRATVVNENSLPSGNTNVLNTATVSATNANTISDTASVNIVRGTTTGSLSIAKTVRNISRGTGETDSTNASPNETVEFIIVVNSGSTSVNNVRVSDSLPGGFRYNSGSTTVNGSSVGDGIIGSGINLGTLNGSSTIRFRANLENESYFPNGSTNLINRADAYGDNVSSVSDTANVYVIRNVGSTALTLNKLVRSFSQSGYEQDSVNVRNGETVEFIIYVTAGGNQTVNNVRLTDYLPSGLRLVSGSATLNGTYLSDSVVTSGVYIGSMYNTTSVVRFRATVESSNYGSYTITNTASVTGDNVPGYTDTARVIVDQGGTIPGGSVSITKTVKNISRGDTAQFSNVAARNGDTVEFDILVRNNSSSNANNVYVTDLLPSGLTYINGNTALDGTLTNDSIINSNGLYLGNLYPGQERRIKLFAIVNSTNGFTLTNIAQVRADGQGTLDSRASVTVSTQGVVAGALDVKTGAAEATLFAVIIAMLGVMIYFFGWDVRKWPLINRFKPKLIETQGHFRI